MKSHLFITLFIVSVSCTYRYTSNSFFGDYVKIESSENGVDTFFAEIELTSDSIINSVYGDSLLVGLISIVNTNDKTPVILEFPFNWHKKFIINAPLFHFRVEEKKDYWVEYFYPDYIDTADNFIRSPVYVTLNPLEKLEIKFLVNPYDNLAKCGKYISLHFRYINNYIGSRRRVYKKYFDKFEVYRTNFIELVCDK